MPPEQEQWQQMDAGCWAVQGLPLPCCSPVNTGCAFMGCLGAVPVQLSAVTLGTQVCGVAYRGACHGESPRSTRGTGAQEVLLWRQGEERALLLPVEKCPH